MKCLLWKRRAAAVLAASVFCYLVGGAGCSPPTPPPPPRSTGVGLDSGGEMRGSVLYHPAPASPKSPPSRYAPVSDKFVIGRRQQMAWALAELDDHAHSEAARIYPVPDPSWRGYTPQKAQAQALRQAGFDAYLLEKYHAHFCNQYGVSYDQIVLIIQEAREKHWPLPPPPEE